MPPLFRGAGSKAIVANLPLSAQRQLYRRHAAAAAEAGLGSNWPAFRATLAGLRKSGHAISLGELDSQNVGIGVPLLHGGGAPPGSLRAVASRTRWEIMDQARVVAMVGRAGAEITELLWEDRSGPARLEPMPADREPI